VTADDENRFSGASIVFLIGVRGSGKTTVGRLLAGRLRCPWLDSDLEIEKRVGRTIATIFAEDGEAGFRDLECRTVAELVDEVRRKVCDRPVSAAISLGGGAVLSAPTRERMNNAGRTVWLDADIDTLMQRLGSDPVTRRPALTELGLVDEVRQIQLERCPIYAGCADLTIDTRGMNPEQVAEKIVRWLRATDK
jgi:shikimate kinase